MGESTWPTGDRPSVHRTLMRSVHVMPAATTSSLFLRILRRRSARFTAGMAWQLFSTPSGRHGSVGPWQFSGLARTLLPFGKASGSRNRWTPFELAPRALYLTWPFSLTILHRRRFLAIAAADLFDATRTGILQGRSEHLYPFSGDRGSP